MKQLIIAAVSMVMLSACGSSKNATGYELPSRDDVKGNWQITDIKLGQAASGEKLAFTLLDEGPKECLIGSSWHFPNNGIGSYTINANGAGCKPGEKSIVWSYRKESGQAIFQYKLMEAGMQAHQIGDGYKFTIISADDSTMELESTIQYQGSPIAITYTFTKS